MFRVLSLAAAMSDSEDELSFESVEEADEENISGHYAFFIMCTNIQKFSSNNECCANYWLISQLICKN